MTETTTADETIFTWGAPPLKFGAGALDEIGFELSQFGVGRVLIVTDATVNAIGIPQRIQDQLAKVGITAEVFDGVHVEPTDDSLDKAAGYAREQGPWDGFVAVGGGSAIDTAKAVNLLVTEGGELMDYINAPIGRATAPRPAETADRGADDGRHRIGEHRGLRARRAVDAREDRHQPLAAAADAGDRRSAADDDPAARGHRLLGHGHRLPRAGVLHRPLVRELRAQGRRRAGHLLRRQPDLGPVEREGAAAGRPFVPRGGAPRRGRPRSPQRHDAGGDLRRDGHRQLGRAHPARERLPDRGHGEGLPAGRLPADEPIVPHGMSVSLTAPQAFRFTFDSAPERHLTAARLLDPDCGGVDAPERLPAVLVDLMRDIGIPNGIGAVGYTEADVAELVPGTMKQQRLLSIAPRTPTEDDIAEIFTSSIENW